MSIQSVSSMNRGNSDVSQFKPDTNQRKPEAAQPIERKASQAHNKQASNELKKAKQDNKKQVYSEDDVLKAIEKANSSIDVKNARFEYSIHEDTKRIMVKVVDTANDEVIKEIPAEEVLDLVAKIWEMSGILLDEKR